MVGEEIKDLNEFKPGDIIYITTDNYINKPMRVRRKTMCNGETWIGLGESKTTMFCWELFLAGRSWIKLIKKFKK